MNPEPRVELEGAPPVAGVDRRTTRPGAVADALTRSLSPQGSHTSLEGALREWARVLRSRGVKPEHMVTTLRELWFQCGGQSLLPPPDDVPPLTLSRVNEVALRAYFRDD